MRAPMILPWVAKKSGISEELALKLWRRAAGEAEVLTGSCRSPTYCELAVERFITLVEQESGCSVSNEALPASMAWTWQRQRRISQMSLIAAENACRQWQNAWQGIYRGRNVA